MKPEAEATRELTPSNRDETGGASARVGDTLAGRYFLVEHLGAGGGGSVFRAHDRNLGREVAVKVLGTGVPCSGAGLIALESEGRALARLDHPHVVAVHDAREFDGVPFLVMDLVHGRSLEQVLRDEGPLPPRRCSAIVRQVCDALDHAHDAGVVHLDVKPSNVLLEEDDCVRLVDFGVARFVGARGDRPMGVTGTAGYLAPEALEGHEPGPCSDVFCTGALLYRMLTGHDAFEGKTFEEVVDRVLHDEPPNAEAVRSNLPRGTGAVLARAMGKEPRARHASAGALAGDLARVLRRQSAGRAGFRVAAVIGIVAVVLAAGKTLRPLSLEAQLRASAVAPGGDGAVELAVRDDTVLHAGDLVWLEGLRPSRDAFIHVLLLDSEGRLEHVYPADTAVEVQIDGGDERAIPPGDKWVLDEMTGVETVFVVASRDAPPVGALEALLATANDGREQGGLRGFDGTAPAPSVHRQREEEIAGLLDETFPALLRFRFRHE